MAANEKQFNIDNEKGNTLKTWYLLAAVFSIMYAQRMRIEIPFATRNTFEFLFSDFASVLLEMTGQRTHFRESLQANRTFMWFVNEMYSYVSFQLDFRYVKRNLTFKLTT